MKTVTTALLAALLVLAPMAASAAVPATISFTGRVADSGAPVTGSHSLTFTLWDVDTGGTPGTNDLWTETKSVTVQDGVLAVSLGDSIALPPGLFNGSPLYLEVAVGTNVMSPRMAIQSVPYAIKAGAADSAAVAGDVTCAVDPCIQDNEIAAVAGAKVTGTVASATNATSATTAANATDLTCGAACVQDGEIEGISGSKVTGPVANATNADTATNATSATTAANATNLSCGTTCVQDAEIQSVSGTKITGWQNLATTAAPTFSGLTVIGNLAVTGNISNGWEMITGAGAPIDTAYSGCTNYASGTCYYGYTSATCSAGKRIIGGGCFIGGIIPQSNIMGSFPSSSVAWQCYANASSSTANVVAYAICARIVP
jgi:hypothetical protein